MVRTKGLAKADCPHGKRVREQAKIDAERRVVRKKSWYSELDADARPVVERLDAEQIAQLDGMKEVERQTKILQYVEEENSKKKQRQLKALASAVPIKKVRHLAIDTTLMLASFQDQRQ